MTLRKIFVIPLLFLATCDVEKPVAVVNAPQTDLVQTEPMPEKWASGYYTGWMRNVCTPAEVDYSALTHVMHFSIGPNSNGTLDLMVNGIWGTAEYNAVTTDLIARTHLYGRKILLSIGGWNTESAWVGATSPTNRTAFIERIISFVQERGYDGVDVDWEPLTDAVAYDSFIREFHGALKTANQEYLLTAACVGEPVFAGLSDLFDQINLMTYDMSGAWPEWVVWHNSALFNGGQVFPKVPEKELPCVANWVDDALYKGIPKEKLGIGTAFQGFIWHRKWETMQDDADVRIEP
jgi:chitinase